MKTKNPRNKLVKICDDLVAKIVKARHPYCVICRFRGEMRSPQMEAGHVIPKSKSAAMRFDLDNVFTQCQYHNSLHRYDTHPYDEWYIAEFGLVTWQALYDRKKVLKSWKMWELKELRDDLQAQLAMLTSKG